MVSINNYIQEKLYIGKGFKTNDVHDFKTLCDYFENHGLYISSVTSGWKKLHADKNNIYPSINIKDLGNSFIIAPYTTMDRREYIIYHEDINNNVEYRKLEGFDIIRQQGHIRLKYTIYNAIKIVDIFNEANK